MKSGKGIGTNVQHAKKLTQKQEYEAWSRHFLINAEISSRYISLKPVVERSSFCDGAVFEILRFKTSKRRHFDP